MSSSCGWKRAGERHQHVLHERDEHRVAAAARHGQIDGCSRRPRPARPHALTRCPGRGATGGSMRTARNGRTPAPAGCRCRVHVPIDDHHALQAMRLHGVTRRDRHVAEQGRTPSPGSSRVVARRTVHRCGRGCGARQEQVDRLHGAAGGMECGLPRTAAHHRVAVDMTAASCRERLDPVEVLGRVDPQQRLAARRPGGASLPGEPVGGASR